MVSYFRVGDRAVARGIKLGGASWAWFGLLWSGLIVSCRSRHDNYVNTDFNFTSFHFI